MQHLPTQIVYPPGLPERFAKIYPPGNRFVFGGGRGVCRSVLPGVRMWWPFEEGILPKGGGGQRTAHRPCAYRGCVQGTYRSVQARTWHAQTHKRAQSRAHTNTCRARTGGVQGASGARTGGHRAHTKTPNVPRSVECVGCHHRKRLVLC